MIRDWEMLVDLIAEKLDLSAWSIKLMISILMGYPLAFIYQKQIRGLSPKCQHVYMAASGAAIFLFNFGLDIYHSILNILFVFVLIHVFGATKVTVAVVFVQQTAYLLVGCIMMSSGLYVVDWTTPQCVLCLRLIGLMWDLYDGSRDEDELSESQKESALDEKPTLLEMMGFSYFFSAFLCGPQFPMRHYLACVEGTVLPRDSDMDVIKSSQLKRVLSCITQGFLCLAVYLYSSRFFFLESFTSPWFFEDTNFFQRVLYMTGFGNLVLFRYLAVWKLVEGPCVLVGLGYNGEKDGAPRHDKVANMRVSRFILGSSCNDMASSFNINTNKWMLEYVYKRLRFLNNRAISQIVTLFYLALWHGAYTGYFLNFFFEFTVLFMEKQLTVIVKRSWLQPYLETFIGRVFAFIVKKSTMLFIIGQALVVFCLLQHELWIPVLKSVYFCPFVFCLWPLLRPLVQVILFPLPSERAQAPQSSEDKRK